MNDKRNPSSPDPLDDWLAQARWPEPTPISTERLRMRWKSITRPSRLPLLAVSIAASVVLMIGAGAIWFARTPSSSGSREVIALTPASIELPGREMTALERTLVAAQERKEALSKKKQLTSATRRTDAASERREEADLRRPLPPRSESSLRSDTGVSRTVASAPSPAPAQRIPIRPLLERIADAETRAATLAELDQMKSPPIDQLFGFFTDSRADLRVAAALALGRIDGPVLTRRLIGMVERNQSRREAFIALASSRGRDARLYIRGAAASEQYAGIARSAMIASEIQ